MTLLALLLLAITPVELPEAVVTGNYSAMQSVDTIGVACIEQYEPATAADLLSCQGRVAVQKSQLGGGSPIIRGFEASRVLLTVDGVRLNNLLYRTGHLQNVISIDPSSLERAAVLYGPASVAAGSDALGGVVAFRTHTPDFERTGGSVLLRGSSSPLATAHADLNIGNRHMASFTSFTFNAFGDLRAGSRRNPFMPGGDSYIHRKYDVTGDDDLETNHRPNRQIGSHYSQYDVVQKLLFRPGDSSDISHGLNFQFSTTGDVPRYDRLTDLKGDKPKFAQWYYGPQQRFFAAYDLAMPGITATVAYQNVKESRHNRKLGDPWLGHRRERVNMLTLTAQWSGSYGTHSISAGIDGALQFLKSTADRENISTGDVLPLDTRYPDGNNYQHNIDAYASHLWRISSRWQLSDGVRAGYNRLQAQFLSDEFFPVFAREYGTVTQNNATYSLSAGISYTPADTWRLALQLSTGYRVPNIDDMGKVFDSQPGMVVVPNPHLKPEQTIGADLNVLYAGMGAVQCKASVFGTYMFDAIALAPATLDGKTEIDYDGTPSRVYANHNCRRAYVAGVSATVTAHIWQNLCGEATATYTYGNYQGGGNEKKEPLDHVPPLYGRAGLSYNIVVARTTIEFYSLFNGRKPLSRYNLNGEDNIGYATVLGVDGRGLPAWMTLNLRTLWQATPWLTLQASLDNMLDTEYRTFGSGISAPGRSLSLSARIKY